MQSYNNRHELKSFDHKFFIVEQIEQVQKTSREYINLIESKDQQLSQLSQEVKLLSQREQSHANNLLNDLSRSLQDVKQLDKLLEKEKEPLWTVTPLSSNPQQVFHTKGIFDFYKGDIGLINNISGGRYPMAESKDTQRQLFTTPGFGKALHTADDTKTQTQRKNIIEYNTNNDRTKHNQLDNIYEEINSLQRKIIQRLHTPYSPPIVPVKFT